MSAAAGKAEDFGVPHSAHAAGKTPPPGAAPAAALHSLGRPVLVVAAAITGAGILLGAAGVGQSAYAAPRTLPLTPLTSRHATAGAPQTFSDVAPARLLTSVPAYVLVPGSAAAQLPLTVRLDSSRPGVVDALSFRPQRRLSSARIVAVLRTDDAREPHTFPCRTLLSGAATCSTGAALRTADLQGVVTVALERA